VTSHSHTVPALLLAARVWPSGLNATDQTVLVGPVRGWPIGVGRAGLATFHSQTFWSSLADDVADGQAGAVLGLAGDGQGELRPLRSATIAVNGAVQAFPPAIEPEQQTILDDLKNGRDLRH
jgi:hypothetical protein